MNGKMKSQRVYAEGQEEAISGADYIYDHHGPEIPSPGLGNQGKLNNTVWTMDPNGKVELRDIGVEYNIVNDFREMKSTTQVTGVDFQTNTFAIGPIVLAVPTGFPKYSRHVDKLNIATTTKVINTFGVLRETIAYDAGASVSTRNKLWDTETGEVLITETVNEYDDRYFSFNFPAHWHYKGMGLAAYNSGLTLPIVSAGGPGFYEMTSSGVIQDYLQEGDEVLVLSDDADIVYEKAWVTDITEGTSDFYLMRADGSGTVTSSSILRVIRSGKRNLQSTSMGSIVLQKDPMSLLVPEGDHFRFDTDKLLVGADVSETHPNHWKKKKIVNAGAVEFRENWDLQCECGIDAESNDYNPYRYNTLGVWRANKSHLYLTGRQHNSSTPNPRSDGFYKTFSSFYKRNNSSSWSIDPTNWTFTSEVTQFSPYGFELENEDALNRFSSAQYGYNFSFPLAVGANSKYMEMGFDGFEDYNFQGCIANEHFGFRGAIPGDPNNYEDQGITNLKSHTGRYSLKVKKGTVVRKKFVYSCDRGQQHGNF